MAVLGRNVPNERRAFLAKQDCVEFGRGSARDVVNLVGRSSNPPPPTVWCARFAQRLVRVPLLANALDCQGD